MYHFAIVALLALATLKLVDYLDGTFGGLDRMKSLLTFAAGIGAVFLMDYSMFDGWGVTLSEDWVSTLMTGFVVAGLTVPWRALFAYLTHDRAETDETLERHSHVRAA